ncbi:MAG: hypothetical protein ABSD20_10250 [Terriglobales bacterium]
MSNALLERSTPELQLVVSNPKHKNHLGRWIVIALGILLACAAIAVKLLVDRAEPIMRARVIDTLSTRFHSRVELDGFHVSVRDGVQVSGEGLRIYRRTDLGVERQSQAFPPVIAVKAFQFRTSVESLLKSTIHVQTVKVDGLVIDVPPREERHEMPTLQGQPGGKPGTIRIVVDRIECDRTKLLIHSSKPGKLPLDFEIRSLVLRRVGADLPMKFDAVLVNPKPVGDIQSSGDFGPWQPDSPRDTPVDGSYTFTHADLGTIKGIGGILSSTGGYSGKLGKIVVDGETDTPDFRLNISGRPLPLHTQFHAIVDGTSGDTYLEPVNARLAHTQIIAKGFVVRVPDRGHEIKLEATVSEGRIDDLLKLAVRTDPPVISGRVSLKAQIDLPPGDPDVARRLNLDGSFQITGVHFSNENIQQKVDSISLRTQGQPQLLGQAHYDDVPSDATGTFTLRQAMLSFSQLQFGFPGTQVNLTGVYGLDGNTFDFHGKVRLEAKLSQMVTGKKRFLLKAIDPFFSKNGAGTEVPIKITGTKSEPQFGLDYGRNDEKKY